MTRRSIAYPKPVARSVRRPIPYAEVRLPSFGVTEAHLHITATGGPLVAQPVIGVLTALYGLGAPFSLWIIARQERVEVGLNCDAASVAALERSVRGATSGWELQRCEHLIVPNAQFRVEATMSSGGRPEWLPLLDIADCRNMDPLAAVLEAVQPLNADEELCITLRTRPADPRRLQQALRELTVPATPATGAAALAALFGKAPRVPRFEPRDQRPLEERLNSPCFEVGATVSLGGHERERLSERARSLTAAYYSGHNAGFGGVSLDGWRWKAGPEDSRWEWDARQSSLLLPISECAVLWHPPSELVTVPGVVRAGRPSTVLPAQLTRPGGLQLGLHRQRGEDVPVYLPRPDLDAGHLIFIGRTGVGKSTAMSNLLSQLAAQPDHPGVWVIDPNVDLQRGLSLQGIPPSRLQDVVLLDLADTEYPIGLPLFTPSPQVSPDAQIQTVFSMLRSIFREHWSETRMADTVFAVTATLCRTPGTTLLDVPRLFNEPAFRRSVVSKLNDPIALQFWADYEALTESARRELSRPVLYRLRSFYRSSAVRNMVCRTDGLDPSELLDRIVFVSLAGDQIQAEADLLGELLIARLHLAALGRLSRPAEQRGRTYLAIDESQHFRGASLPVLWSEGRKLGITLIMATQFIEGWGETLAQTVLGNAGSVVAFRCGPGDSHRLANTIRPFTSEQLEDLNRHEAIVKLQAGGVTIPAFDITTLPATGAADPMLLAQIRAASRARYARPRKEVEAEIDAAYFKAAPAWDGGVVDEE